MPAATYDIFPQQGINFKLHLQYSDGQGNSIPLSGFQAQMQVRDSETSKNVYLFLSEEGLTGGGITGDFDPTTDEGVPGQGGIVLDMGADETPGVTGGILIKIDRVTMSNLPAKKYFYDLKLINESDEATRLIEGIFDVHRQITR